MNEAEKELRYPPDLLKDSRYEFKFDSNPWTSGCGSLNNHGPEVCISSLAGHVYTRAYICHDINISCNKDT